MERIIEGNTEFLCWAILGAMPEPGDVPQPPTKRVKHEIVNGWCLTCRRAKCQVPPNPKDAAPLPRLPPARTPREQQERIDRARAAQPIVRQTYADGCRRYGRGRTCPRTSCRWRPRCMG